MILPLLLTRVGLMTTMMMMTMMMMMMMVVVVVVMTMTMMTIMIDLLRARVTCCTDISWRSHAT